MPGTFCCVYGCNSRPIHGCSFHRFPKKGQHVVEIEGKTGLRELIDRRTAWELRLRMGKKASDYMNVCSRHFSNACFILPDCPAKRRVLKKCAVPDQNLPAIPKRGSVRSPRKRRRVERQSAHSPEHQRTEVCLEVEDDVGTADDIFDLLNPEPSQPLSSTSKTTTFKDFAVQVKSGDLQRPFISLVNSNKALNSLAGVPTMGMFEMLVRLVNSTIQDQRVHKLTLRERVLLTLMKPKINVSFSVLCVLFQTVTGKTCRIIFEETLASLAGVLGQSAIYFPGKEEILQNMPLCFAKYRTCRLVLDCTEVQVQKPKCLKCRIKPYSQYKSGLTVKFLTGVTPTGTISYLSKAFGGRASDKAIFEQSNVVSLLERGDAIMVDKGFLIDEICHAHGIDIIRPPFLKDKKQLSRVFSALASRDIAAARVHIERSNQRIKQYMFFNSKLQWSMSHLIEYAFTVVCGLTNLCSPLLADDKFIS